MKDDSSVFFILGGLPVSMPSAWVTSRGGSSVTNVTSDLENGFFYSNDMLTYTFTINIPRNKNSFLYRSFRGIFKAYRAMFVRLMNSVQNNGLTIRERFSISGVLSNPIGSLASLLGGLDNRLLQFLPALTIVISNSVVVLGGVVTSFNWSINSDSGVETWQITIATIEQDLTPGEQVRGEAIVVDEAVIGGAR